MRNPPLFFNPNDHDYFGTAITLRDLFAGMAMQGMESSAYESRDPHAMHPPYALNARRAYRIADALLRAREESE